MSTDSWNTTIYSNQERTLFGCELWSKSKKIFESECIYSKEDAKEMEKEFRVRFGIKDE
jgi:hypothetical protein